LWDLPCHIILLSSGFSQITRSVRSIFFSSARSPRRRISGEQLRVSKSHLVGLEMLGELLPGTMVQPAIVSIISLTSSGVYHCTKLGSLPVVPYHGRSPSTRNPHLNSCAGHSRPCNCLLNRKHRTNSLTLPAAGSPIRPIIPSSRTLMVAITHPNSKLEITRLRRSPRIRTRRQPIPNNSPRTGTLTHPKPILVG